MFTIANYTDTVAKERGSVPLFFLLAFYIFYVGIPFAVYSIVFFLIKIFKKKKLETSIE